MPYDPQRSRHRPPPADDAEPAPVDALLEGHPADDAEAPLPEGVELDVTEGGEVLIHTADADIEVTASGDDVVVRTGDANVEVRAEDDEVVVTAGDEELYVDTTPRSGADLDSVLADEMQAGAGRTRLVAAVLAAVAAAVLVLLALRRRRG